MIGKFERYSSALVSFCCLFRTGSAGKSLCFSDMVIDEYFWDIGLGGPHDPQCHPHSHQPASSLVKGHLSPRSILLLILNLGGEEGCHLLGFLKTRLPICPLFHAHAHPDRHQKPQHVRSPLGHLSLNLLFPTFPGALGVRHCCHPTFTPERVTDTQG